MRPGRTVMVVSNRGDAAISLELTRFSERLAAGASTVDVATGHRLKLHDALEMAPRSVMLLEIE